MASFLDKFKRRNVFRVALGYLVLAWAALQITDIIAPAMRLPDWTIAMVTFLCMAGFPFALFFAWALELSPVEGLPAESQDEGSDRLPPARRSSPGAIFAAVLAVVIIGLLADRFLNFSGRVEDLEEAPETNVKAEVLASKKPHSIAVLPFVNMSNDPDQEYFSDGISEELLNALASIRELRVAARTSSFAFKGKNQDITLIGDQLNVETVLEGSVRKSGKRLRITAQLVKVSDGYHLWSKTYDRDLTDIFAVQDEISAAIVSALKVHLSDSSEVSAVKRFNTDAYNLVLQARHYQRNRSRESLERALELYQQALDLEPTYAAAWAGKATSTSLLGNTQYGNIPEQEARRLAQAYLDLAFSLDPDLGMAHASQALQYINQNKPAEALVSIDKALSANPSEGILYSWKHLALMNIGRYNAATIALERAFAVDPLHPTIRRNWTRRLVATGRQEDALALSAAGSVSHIEAQWFVAQSEGRWADMLRVLDQAAALPDTTDVSSLASPRGYTLLLWLKEVTPALDLLPAFIRTFLRSLEDPQSAVAQLAAPGRGKLDAMQGNSLNIALIGLGRCDEVIVRLADGNFESGVVDGDPGTPLTRFSFAAHLAWCLRETGELERAETLADRLMQYAEYVDMNGHPPDYMFDLAVIQMAKGDPAAAVKALRRGYDANTLSALNYAIPFFRQLEERSDYQALKAAHNKKLNVERGKLGWAPAALDGLPSLISQD